MTTNDRQSGPIEGQTYPAGVTTTMSTIQVSPPAGLQAPGDAPAAGRGRCGAGAAALAAVGLASGLLVVQQVGAGELLGVLTAADPLWLAVAVGASVVPLVGAALSLGFGAALTRRAA